MLTHLVIKNFAIIAHLEIPFREGYTVLTGETGAGKSIIIDALNLILGGRASTEVIRTEEDEAVVEAIFVPSKPRLEAINARLIDSGIEPGGELIVRRIVSRSGRNKVFINGSLSTVSALGEITDGMVDISGQHEHYSLLREETHLAILDACAEAGALHDAMRGKWQELSALRRRLRHLREGIQERLSRIDYLKFQLDEIDRAGLKAGEDAELQAEFDRLRHAEKIAEGAARAAELCYEGDGSAVEQLAEAVGLLERASQWAPALGELVERLEEANITVTEVSRELAGFMQEVDADPARIDHVVSRLETLKRLKRKHSADSVDQVMERAREMRAEVRDLENAEELGDELEAAVAAAEADALEVAFKLSQKRRQAAEALAERVERELADLNMQNTRFVVRFGPEVLPTLAELLAAKAVRWDDEATPSDDEQALAGQITLGPTGFDTVEFLIAPNVGEAAKPLSKIASGGELSRLMLAIKSVLMELDAVETYVFDEVDTGIGGETADVVGDKIRRTADSHQVLCITHLPQISSRSDHHYLVEKITAGGRTQSRIRPLEEDERVEELARMLGGTRVTAKTRDAARELLAR